MSPVRTQGDEIATLTIAGKTDLNLLTFELMQELDETLQKLATQKGLKVLVLTGQGDRSFCAGADLRQLAELMASPERVREFVELGCRTLERLEQFPLPVIGAINGHALGAGFELATACDLRLLKTTARLGQPAASLGLVPPFGGTTRLPRLVGEARAKELWFTAAPLTPEQALDWGLANRIAPAAKFAAAVADMAGQVAQAPRSSLLGIKQAWIAATVHGRGAALAAEAEALYVALTHNDVRELLRRQAEGR